MKPIIIINTFKQIFFKKDIKPIVICDIDYTFIRPISTYKELFEQFKTKFSNPIELDKMILETLQSSIILGTIVQTDKEGFLFMLERINELGGKLIFLTARSSISHKKTLDDLKKVGLENPESYEIHYTGNEITKGDYIKKFDLLKGYDHHIFIDDHPHFLESALRIYPNMNCYLFKCYK
jgi:predicted secreted acid phosphatase